MGQPAEDQSEKNHAKQRLDNGPRNAESRLPVAQLDFAPSKEIQQFPVTPKLAH
jgi:hypothetical protein